MLLLIFRFHSLHVFTPWVANIQTNVTRHMYEGLDEETASSLAVAAGAFPHSKEMVLDLVEELLSGDWNLHFHGSSVLFHGANVLHRCPGSRGG